MALDKKEQKQIERAQIVIDQVVEYLAMKWTKTQIFNHLRGTFPDLKRRTVRALIRKAGKDIMARYGINPEEYKGEQIAFYEYVIRGRSYDRKDGCKSTVKERLVAAERLDKLFNLENIVNSDPADKAAQIMEFIKQARATVGSGVNPNESKEPGESGESGESVSETNGTAERGRTDGDKRSTVADQTGATKQAEPGPEPGPEPDQDDSGDNLGKDGDVLEKFGQEVV